VLRRCRRETIRPEDSELRTTHDSGESPMKCIARALVICAALAAGLGLRVSYAQDATAAPTAADVDAGKVLVQQQCKACHGVDGRSIAPGIPNLAGQSYRYLVTALREYRQGQRIHAAVKIMAENLTEAGERAVRRISRACRPRRPLRGAGRRSSRPTTTARSWPRPARSATARTATAQSPARPA
jgi:cytochrome c553